MFEDVPQRSRRGEGCCSWPAWGIYHAGWETVAFLAGRGDALVVSSLDGGPWALGLCVVEAGVVLSHMQCGGACAGPGEGSVWEVQFSW